MESNLHKQSFSLTKQEGFVMKKRVVSLTLAASMAVSLLAGCGSSNNQGGSAGADGKQVLKFAAIETAYGSGMWDAIATAFEKTHEGVDVQVTVDRNIEDVISPGMKAGDYPDVVHLAVGREKALTETLVKEKGLEDLTSVLDMTIPNEDVKVKDKLIAGFTDNSITNPYDDGKTYLMPMFYGPCGLFYNASLMKEKGWEVPTTWDEMWALGDKAKAEGISLFTYPHAGYFDAFFYALLNEAGGDEFFDEATHYEEGIWQTAEAKKVFDTVGKLATYTDPTTPANANNDNFAKNQQLVIDGQALFMPNGTWVVGEMAASTPDDFEWGFMALPALEDGGDRYSYTFFEQIWVPAAAQNKDLAKEFIAFLYSDEAANIFINEHTGDESIAVQPIANITDMLNDENKMLYSIYDVGAKPAMGAFASTTPVEGVSIADAAFQTVNSLVSGDKTQSDWEKAITEASDALRPALQ